MVKAAIGALMDLKYVLAVDTFWRQLQRRFVRRPSHDDVMVLRIKLGQLGNEMHLPLTACPKSWDSDCSFEA